MPQWHMMFPNLSDIFKIPLAVFAGIVISVVFYEGIRLPWVGQIVPGIVWYRENAATSNMVTTFERDALKAQLDKEKSDRKIAEAASAKAQERADATAIARQIADVEITRLRAEARTAQLLDWTPEELEWYEKH